MSKPQTHPHAGGVTLRLAVDAMGGDHGPATIVEAVKIAAERLAGAGVAFELHGDRAKIAPLLQAQGAPLNRVCEIVHTELLIASDEKPAAALRRGKGSSLWNTIEAVRSGRCAAAISGGNTGALMAISKLQLRMAGTLDRPAIVASWPTLRGISSVLDVGANIGCDAGQLVEFAIMGEAFHAAVHLREKTSRPTVGVLNVGSEELKGNEVVRDAHRMLRESEGLLVYHGFVEGDDIAKGTVDVVVTDGFTGNVALKTGEGLARFFGATLRETFHSSWRARLGGLLAQGALRALRRRLTPPGGGPLLGLNGIVVKSHGGASPESFADAVMIAHDLAASDYAVEVATNLARFAARRSVPTAGAMRAGATS